MYLSRDISSGTGAKSLNNPTKHDSFNSEPIAPNHDLIWNP